MQCVAERQVPVFQLVAERYSIRRYAPARDCGNLRRPGSGRSAAAKSCSMIAFRTTDRLARAVDHGREAQRGRCAAVRLSIHAIARNFGHSKGSKPAERYICYNCSWPIDVPGAAGVYKSTHPKPVPVRGRSPQVS